MFAHSTSLSYSTLTTLCLALLCSCGGKPKDNDTPDATSGADTDETAGDGDVPGDGDGDDTPHGSGGNSAGDGDGGSGTGGSPTASGGAGSNGGIDHGGPMMIIDIFATMFEQPPVQRVQARWLDGLANADCEETVIDDCQVRRCPVEEPAAPTAPSPHVGVIEVSVEVTEGTLSAVLTPDELGRYEFQPFSGNGQMLGDEIGTARADGGTLGPFLLDVRVPLLLINTQPLDVLPLDGYAAIQIPRASSRTITWDRGIANTYYVVQTRPSEDNPRTTLSCWFPSEAGQGEIDPSLLQELPESILLDTFTVRVYDKTLDSGLVRVRIVTSTTTPTKDSGVRLSVP